MKEKTQETEGLARSSAPGTGVNAARVQNEGGFYGGRKTTVAGGLINPDQRRQAQDLIPTGGANDPILFDQEIHVVLLRTTAGQAAQSSVNRRSKPFGTGLAGQGIRLNGADLWHIPPN